FSGSGTFVGTLSLSNAVAITISGVGFASSSSITGSTPSLHLSSGAIVASGAIIPAATDVFVDSDSTFGCLTVNSITIAASVRLTFDQSGTATTNSLTVAT